MWRGIEGVSNNCREGGRGKSSGRFTQKLRAQKASIIDCCTTTYSYDLDCRKTCVKGTLNPACDTCICDDHVLTGRVQTTNNAPIAGAKVAKSETPYKALARTDDKGFFKALNVCADANQELLISAAGFVPVQILAIVSSSNTSNVQVRLQNSGTFLFSFS